MNKQLKQRRKIIFAVLRKMAAKTNPINAFVEFFSKLLSIDKRLNPKEYEKPELVDSE